MSSSDPGGDTVTDVATLMLGEAPVARIGLGTNRLKNTPENVAFVRDAGAAGVGLIDTAHSYTGGESEETIGAALSSSRDRCVVATKGGWGSGRPDVLRAEVEESLRRLRTDRIDLYYLHRPDPKTPLQESLAVIAEYRERGAIQHIGVSNVSVDEIERAREVAPIVAVQNHYNLSERRHDDVVDYCAENGIIFVAYFPLRAGGGPPAAEIAKRHGSTPAQIALAWLLQRSPTVLPIPGTLSREHLRENLVATEMALTDEEIEVLTQSA
jgi:aryl-alcohol dehydrogenase-like predicted oxidoreductase